MGNRSQHVHSGNSENSWQDLRSRRSASALTCEGLAFPASLDSAQPSVQWVVCLAACMPSLSLSSSQGPPPPDAPLLIQGMDEAGPSLVTQSALRFLSREPGGASQLTAVPSPPLFLASPCLT